MNTRILRFPCLSLNFATVAGCPAASFYISSCPVNCFTCTITSLQTQSNFQTFQSQLPMWVLTRSEDAGLKLTTSLCFHTCPLGGSSLQTNQVQRLSGRTLRVVVRQVSGRALTGECSYAQNDGYPGEWLYTESDRQTDQWSYTKSGR